MVTQRAVHELIDRIPFFASAIGWAARPQSGAQSLNNAIWVVSRRGSSDRYALRIANPSGSRHLGIDRVEEHRAARLAGEAGVGPEVLSFDEDTGAMVTPWLEGARPWDYADLADPQRVRRLLQLVRRMHALDLPAGTTTWHDLVTRQLDGAERLGLELPPDIADLRSRLTELWDRRAADTRRAAGLNHHDLAPNNLLDDGHRFWIVDWEFAGRGDGWFDLATISMGAGNDRDADARMLADLGLDRPDDVDSLSDMKWVARFFEAGWGLVMDGIDTDHPATDYGAHARRMFAELRSNP